MLRRAVHEAHHELRQRGGREDLPPLHALPVGCRRDEGCPNTKDLRAEAIEEQAWEFVTHLVLHPSRLEAELDREIGELRRQTRLGDPEEEQGRLLRDLAWVDRQRETLQREAAELVADGLLDRELLRRKLAELDGREAELEKELAAARATHERIEDLEMLKAELPNRYLYEGPKMLARRTPEQRVALYHRIGFRAFADEGGNPTATWLFGAETFSVPVESTTRCSPCKQRAPLPCVGF